MAFSIEIGRFENEKIALDKTFAIISTLSGTLKDKTSIVDPVILIEGNIASFVNCNYIHIPIFSRYYFITNIQSVRNGLFELSAHVDVLNSFKDDIRGNTAIIAKQENEWNLYINDGSLKIYQNPLVQTKKFPYGFDTYEYLLAVAGSAQDEPGP